jgi:hypothetical protein
MPAFDEEVIGGIYTRKCDVLDPHYKPNTSPVRREAKESPVNSRPTYESYIQSDISKKLISRSDTCHHTLELGKRLWFELMKAILLLGLAIVVFLRIIAQEINVWVELWEHKRELQDHCERETIRIRTTRITCINNALKAQKLKTRPNRIKR